MRKFFQQKLNHLPVRNRQRMNRRKQPHSLIFALGSRFRMRPRVDGVLRFAQLIEWLVAWPAFPYMAERAIVRDAVDKGSLRAFTAKMRESFPDGQRNVLHQLFAAAHDGLIAGRQTRKRRGVFSYHAVKLLLQLASVGGGHKN